MRSPTDLKVTQLHKQTRSSKGLIKKWKPGGGGGGGSVETRNMHEINEALMGSVFRQKYRHTF